MRQGESTAFATRGPRRASAPRAPARGRESGASIWPKAVVWLGVGTLLAVLAALVVGDVEGIAVAAAFVPALLIAAFQAFNRDRELFQPLSFVFLTVFFGVTVQTFYLVHLDDGGHRFAVGSMTDGATLLTAIVAVTVGIVALLAGYASGGESRRSARPDREMYWSETRVRMVVIACLAIGLFSLAYYATVFDVLDTIREQYTVKRRLVDDDTGVAQTLSWVRFGVNFSQLAFYVAFADYLRRGGRSGFMRTLVIVSAIAGVVMPFIASSRLGVITFVISGAMIHHFSTGGWPVKRLKTVFIASLVIILAMGTLRYVQARGITYSAYRDAVSVEQMLEPVLGSSNFLAVGKTAAIMEAVPAALEHQYGKTYLLWTLAPIPRTIWPDKPIIRIGAELSEAVFGSSLGGGVPPGVIGELYLNFGWIGIPFGMFVLGFAFRRFYNAVGLPAYRNVNRCVIYSSLLVFVAFTGMSADFTGMMSMTLQRIVPLLAIILFVSRSRQLSRGPGRPPGVRAGPVRRNA